MNEVGNPGPDWGHTHMCVCGGLNRLLGSQAASFW